MMSLSVMDRVQTRRRDRRRRFLLIQIDYGVKFDNAKLILLFNFFILRTWLK